MVNIIAMPNEIPHLFSIDDLSAFIRMKLQALQIGIVYIRAHSSQSPLPQSIQVAMATSLLWL